MRKCMWDCFQKLEFKKKNIKLNEIRIGFKYNASGEFL